MGVGGSTRKSKKDSTEENDGSAPAADSEAKEEPSHSSDESSSAAINDDDKTTPHIRQLIKPAIPPRIKLTFGEQITSIVRFELRSLLGSTVYEHCGHFVDFEMSHIIHSYTGLVYPKGDFTLKHRKRNAVALVFSDDGRCIFFVCDVRWLVCWDMLKNELIHEWLAHSHEYEVCCLSFRKGLLASGGAESNSISLWKCEKFNRIGRLYGHRGTVHLVEFNKDGDLLVSGSKDHSLRLWSLPSGECLCVWNGHNEASLTGIFVSDVQLLSGSHDKSLKLWNINDEECVVTFKEGITGLIRRVMMSCDGQRLVCICNCSIVVYHWPSMTVIGRIMDNCNASCFHPRMPHLLAVHSTMKRSVLLLNLDNLECTQLFKVNELDFINVLRFSHDGSKLVSAGLISRVQVWDVPYLLSSIEIIIKK